MGCLWSDEKKHQQEISQLNSLIESLNQRHEAAIKERERELERARNERLADQRKHQNKMEEMAKDQEIEKVTLISEFEGKLAEKDRLLREMQEDLIVFRVEERQKLERLKSENNAYVEGLEDTFDKKLEAREETLREIREELAQTTRESRVRMEDMLQQLQLLMEELRECLESGEREGILRQCLARLAEFKFEMAEHHLKRIETRERRGSIFDLPIPKRRKSSGNVARYTAPEEVTTGVLEEVVLETPLPEGAFAVAIPDDGGGYENIELNTGSVTEREEGLGTIGVLALSD